MHLTTYDKRKIPFLDYARSGIGYTSVVATITIVQWSKICNLQNSRAIVVIMAYSEVSVTNYNLGAICRIVPISLGGTVVRGAVNLDSTISIRICVQSCSVKSVSIISKFLD